MHWGSQLDDKNQAKITYSIRRDKNIVQKIMALEFYLNTYKEIMESLLKLQREMYA
jgi:hypothetical protein